MPQMVFEYILKKHGLDPKTDLNIDQSINFGLTAADITSWPALGSLIVQAVSNPYVLCLAAVSVWNALQDPTTPGLSDSTRALGYTTPGGKD